MARSPELELNEYLALEWGHEGEVTADRPFALRRLGEIGDSVAYEFFDGDHREFAFHGRVLSCMAAGNMTLEDLRRQERGRAWIGDREPVDLATAKIGDERVPGGVERRTAIERLIADAGHDPGTTRIVEGVFLVAERRSIAVVETAGGDRLALLGGTVAPVPAVMRELSGWRQLAHAVGRRLDPV
jgi:hypothetical protein